MRIDTDLADHLMEQVSAYLGSPISDYITFTFHDDDLGDGDPIATLLISGFENDMHTGRFKFEGDGTDQITGNVIKSGRASYFIISTSNGSYGECFRGSVGVWADTEADIHFNERDWSEGDILIISGLTLSIPKGDLAVFD